MKNHRIKNEDRFVLLVWSGPALIPTIEFETSQLCEAAADKVAEITNSKLLIGHGRRGVCVQLQKEHVK